MHGDLGVQVPGELVVATRENRQAADARRFYRDGGNTDGLKPVGQTVEIAGEAVERPYGLIAQVRRDGDDMKRRPDIEPGGTRVDDVHR